MVNLDRRLFLGGALSLIAAQTFTPSISDRANIPTIYGNGVQDDVGGLSALFRNEPVTFDKEMIGIESHNGIIFHYGRYVISRTIEIPDDCNLNIEMANFISRGLDIEIPFFITKETEYPTIKGLRNNLGLIFEAPKIHKSPFIMTLFDKKLDIDEVERRKHNKKLSENIYNLGVIG